MNSSVEKLLFRFGRFCNYKLLVCLWLRRCKETSVFAVAHILSHFFLYISLMSLFREFPAFTMFAISCHALFLPPEVIDEENFAFKIKWKLSEVFPVYRLILYLLILGNFVLIFQDR
jgi:hypothetical protein